MESLHELEISILLFIQSLGAWMAGPLQAASLLGNEDFFMLVMPSLYWSLDATLGMRMAVMLILSNGFNCFFKLAFLQPRPYWIDGRILPLSSEISFGIPSGHAMNAASLWGLMVVWMKQPWAKVAGLLVIFFIGFSRLFLGMHFISDVLVGWLMGGLLLYVFLRYEARLMAWLNTCGFQKKISLALASSLGIIAVLLLCRAALGSWQVPESWLQNASQQPGGKPIDPLNIDSAFTLAGIWFGMLAGAAWFQQRYGSYEATGTPLQRLLRYLIGVVGIFIFWFALGKVFPREANLLSYSLRYLRYILVGLWITAFAPLIFYRVGLMRKAVQNLPSFSAN